MKILQIFLLVTFAFGTAQGQFIAKYDAGKLHKIYNYDEMDKVFSTNVLAHKEYRKSLKNKKAFIGWGYAALGVMTIGTGSAFRTEMMDNDNDGDNDILYDKLAMYSLFVVAPIIGAVALTYKFIEVKQRFRAINLMNGQKSIELGCTPSTTMEINAAMGANGIGLTLTF